ncbi:MAG: alkaline phosphatase family protein [Candidatus Neomarinimicrobiota bacterium]|nr:MAG: alkaline phosphatase family protein [Candidatus Neomarinimicrobiota bacterium]
MKNNFLVFLVFFLTSCNQVHETIHGSSSGTDLSYYGEPSTPLILISIDGFRWDYFDKVETPNFDRLIANGSKADGLKTSYPSKTFPNHISIVTGNYPSNHGIISNYFYDADFDEYFYIGAGSTAAQDGKWIDAEPIWVTIEKQAKRAMIMFWPMSDAEIMGIRPSKYYVYNEDPTNLDRMDQILSWLLHTGNARPSFLASYFSVVDSKGHSYGPDGDETIEAIRVVDKAIGHLIDGLEAQNILNEVNIMIVSDHGMTETPDTKVINIADYINLDDVVTVGGGPFMEIRPNEGKLESVYQALQNIDNTQVFKKEDIPDKFNYKNNNRIEPILLLADEHWSIMTPGRTPIAGSHGYDPDYQSMNGIFIAHGPAFKSGFSGPEIHNIHLYEMMCKILGVVPANNDGSLDVSNVFLND